MKYHRTTYNNNVSTSFLFISPKKENKTEREVYVSTKSKRNIACNTLLISLIIDNKVRSLVLTFFHFFTTLYSSSQFIVTHFLAILLYAFNVAFNVRLHYRPTTNFLKAFIKKNALVYSITYLVIGVLFKSVFGFFLFRL